MKQNLRKKETMALTSVPSVSPPVPTADITPPTPPHSLPLALDPGSELQQRLWSLEWVKAGERL